MKKFIQRIESEIPYTNFKVDIQLDGHNLIITGGNGSGKTSLLKTIFDRTQKMAKDKKYHEVDTWKERVSQFENELLKHPVGSANYRECENNIKVCQSNIDPYIGPPTISIDNFLEFERQVAIGYGAVTFFAAQRQSDISEAKSASGLFYSKDNLASKNHLVGNELEQHLVNLATRRAFAEANSSKDPQLAEKITRWFHGFEKNLQFLFENPTVQLKFDADKFKFYIFQEGRVPATFQNLSSGYSAILNILSALLMRAEYIKDDPSTLCGVVFIDEIDAHLHVSLQRKIFPFLTNAFPKMQFIVTTHSPFILTSVNDAVIYDINRREQVDDLSAYSYESVLEGLFGVSQSSILLQNKVKDLAALISGPNMDSEAVMQLVKELTPYISHLDEESKFYVNRAQALLNTEGSSSV